jgi:hypothetical protein
MKVIFIVLINLSFTYCVSQKFDNESDFLISIGKKSFILNKDQYKNELKVLQKSILNNQLNSNDFDSIQKVKLLEMSNELNLNFDEVIGEINPENVSKAIFYQRKIKSKLVQYFAYDNFINRDYEIIDLKNGNLTLLALDSLTVIKVSSFTRLLMAFRPLRGFL